jgi:hypothetical protein
VLILLIISIFSFQSCKKDAPTDAPEIVTKLIGSITNKASSAALQGVQVTTIPTTSTITTDANGKYEFSKITAGSYVIKATKSGFKDAQINVNVLEGNTAQADIQMEELTSEIDVTPSFADFGVANNQITIAISNKSGIGTLNFTLNKNASWLSLSENSGSITTNVKYITLTVNRETVEFGTFNDVVTINSNVGVVILNVQMVKQNPNAPQLTATPIVLDFSTNQSELGVTLSNTGTGDLTWNASTQDGWISVTPNSGTIGVGSSNVQIKVNRSGLNPGNYNGSVTFSSNGGNQTVTVKLTIPSSPILNVSPKDLDFGEIENLKFLQINNIGTGTLSWNIVSNQNWLTVSPSQGSNFLGVNVTVNRENMTTGTYSGLLSISSDGGNDQVNVTMQVPPPAPPPSVVLGTPENVTAFSCDLRWQQSTLSASNFSSYKIYYDTQPNVTENSTLAATITNINTITKNITDLSGSTKYYFRVYVVNSLGGSAGSNIVNITTDVKLGTWSVAITLTGVNPTPNCLFAVSETDVWVVGDEIWHYNGTTWIKDLKPAGIGKLLAVYFSSANEGWAVGENSTVICYNGSTWTKVTSSVFPTSTTFYDVVLTGGSDVWISGYGAFYHFDGNVWVKSSVSANYLKDMDIISSNEIYAVDENSYFLKFNGVGWSKVSSPSFSLYEVSALSSSNLWFEGSSKIIRFDGNVFTATSTNIDAWSLDMISENDGWAGGYNFLYHYNGVVWKEVTSPISSTIKCIKMTSSKTGWAVGSNGEVLRYRE